MTTQKYPNIVIFNLNHDLTVPLVEQFYRFCNNIILVDQNLKAMTEIEKKYNDLNTYIHKYQIDWHNYEVVNSIIDEIIELFTVIHCFIFLTDYSKVELKKKDIDPDNLIEMLNINFISSSICIYRILEIMQKQNRGEIFVSHHFPSKILPSENILYSIRKLFYNHVKYLQNNCVGKPYNICNFHFDGLLQKRADNELLLKNIAQKIFTCFSHQFLVKEIKF